MGIEDIKKKLEKLYLPIRGKMNTPLGVYALNNEVHMLFKDKESRTKLLSTVSTDGFSFQMEKNALTVPQGNLKISQITQFTQNDDTYLVIKDDQSKTKSTQKAQLNEGILSHLKPVGFTTENVAIVSGYQHESNYVMYYGDRSVNVAYSKDMSSWQKQEKPVLQESFPVKVEAVFNLEEGILLLYFGTTIENGHSNYCAYLALFSAENPERLIWKSSGAIWNQKDQWPHLPARYIGSVSLHNHLISYWHVNNQVIYGVLVADALVDSLSNHNANTHTKLIKHESNPIIAPNDENDWEAFNTFNPTALYTNGKVHIMYRAQGFDYIST
ncbi:MAG: hypothetical protein ABIO02_04285, partial [Patescibacteria group bacterium]